LASESAFLQWWVVSGKPSAEIVRPDRLGNHGSGGRCEWWIVSDQLLAEVVRTDGFGNRADKLFAEVVRTDVFGNRTDNSEFTIHNFSIVSQ
jgi:hypothetical protein